MKIKAFAKINLGLKILNKRNDGFHNIETIFHRINLFDEIEIIKTKSGIAIEVLNFEAINNESNLCYKAAKLLKEYGNVKSGVLIKLKKNIPIGAGLGGGSSDAATVLLGLKKIWNLKISEMELKNMALKLGSDVPYFLKTGSAIAKSRGEDLKYFKMIFPYIILVVNPGVHVSTSWAYKKLSENKKRRMNNLEDLDFKKLENDFEQIVFKKFPEIKEIKTKLLKNKAVATLLSGSGASVFGLFKNKKDAIIAKNKFYCFTSLTNKYF